MKTPFILILVTILFVFSCKKDNDPVTPEESQETTTNTPTETNEIQLHRTDYNVFEIAYATLNDINPSSTSYTGSINGVSVPVEVTNGEITFIIPNIVSGSYNLNVNIDGNNYSTVNFNVTKLNPIANPTVFMASLSTEFNNDFQEIRANIDSLSIYINTVTAYQDVTEMENYYNQLLTDFNNLSAQEKQVAVDVYNAQVEQMADFDLAVDALVFDYPSYMRMGVFDWTERIWNRATQFKNAVQHAVASNATTVAAMTTAGAIVGGSAGLGIGSGPGALIGFGLATIKVCKNNTMVANALDNFVNDVLDISIWTAQKSSIMRSTSFTNGVANKLDLRGDFISGYSGNATTNSFRSDLNSSSNNFANTWNDFKNAAPWNITREATTLSSIASPINYNDLEIHARYVQINYTTNNPNVRLESYYDDNGDLMVEYSNSNGSIENFDIELIYSSFLGYSTITIPATIEAHTIPLAWSNDGDGAPSNNSSGAGCTFGNLLLCMWEGGIPPYQISTDGGTTWKTPSDGSSSSTSESLHIEEDLWCGQYDIIVKDAVGTQISETIILN
jgi:hypothetical protein